jgi:RNA polymerase sigma factor FliA
VRKEELEPAEAPPEEAALWQRYLSSQDGAARKLLIDRHLIVAQKVAAMLYASRYDDSVEFAEYLQYARVGLLEAIERYDPAREASFATFATYRIRGAILNGIERSTELATQRAQRRRLRRERLKSIHDDRDESEDDEFGRMVDLTLKLAIGYLLEESGIWKAEEADRAADPYVSLEVKRLGERLSMLVAALPEREQQIVRYHYFEHKEFVEIGSVMGLSKGRVSQLHVRALRLLREGYDTLNRFDQRV